jgi:hypothetical protein
VKALAAAVLLASFVAGCSHVQVNANSATSSGAAAAPSSGTSVTSSSAGVQASSGSRGLTNAIIAVGLVAGAIEYSRDPRPFPSPAALLPANTPPAPALAPDRRVSEQDCTRPIDLSSGNLRCK